MEVNDLNCAYIPAPVWLILYLSCCMLHSYCFKFKGTTLESGLNLDAIIYMKCKRPFPFFFLLIFQRIVWQNKHTIDLHGAITEHAPGALYL